MIELPSYSRGKDFQVFKWPCGCWVKFAGELLDEQHSFVLKIETNPELDIWDVAERLGWKWIGEGACSHEHGSGRWNGVGLVAEVANEKGKTTIGASRKVDTDVKRAPFTRTQTGDNRSGQTRSKNTERVGTVGAGRVRALRMKEEEKERRAKHYALIEQLIQEKIARDKAEYETAKLQELPRYPSTKP